MKNLLSTLFLAVSMIFGNVQAAANPPIPEVVLCRAAIAHQMRKPLDEILYSVNVKEPTVIYQRKQDQKLFMYKCKVVGDRILWSMYIDTSGWGRWRDSADDDQITYSVDSKAVTTTVYGESKTWLLGQLN